MKITSSTETVCHQGKCVRPGCDQASENHDHWKLGLGPAGDQLLELTPGEALIAGQGQAGAQCMLAAGVGEHRTFSRPKTGATPNRMI
jgi:hypothetical protein